jgi:hypothetical protein
MDNSPLHTLDLQLCWLVRYHTAEIIKNDVSDPPREVPENSRRRYKKPARKSFRECLIGGPRPRNERLLVYVLGPDIGKHVFDGPRVLLVESDFEALKYAATQTRCRYRWKSFYQIIALWRDTVQEVRTGLGERRATEWHETCHEMERRLTDRPLLYHKGVVAIQAWIRQIRLLLRELGKLALVPFPDGSFPTLYHAPRASGAADMLVPDDATARMGDGLPNVGAPKGKPCKRMTHDEANSKAMKLAKKMKKKFFALSRREQAELIGCSFATWKKTEFFKTAERRRPAKAPRKPSSPKTVSLTNKVEAVTGEGGRDQVLKGLIAEQEADKEPSPLDSADQRQTHFRKKL